MLREVYRESLPFAQAAADDPRLRDEGDLRRLIESFESADDGQQFKPFAGIAFFGIFHVEERTAVVILNETGIRFDKGGVRPQQVERSKEVVTFENGLAQGEFGIVLMY